MIVCGPVQINPLPHMPILGSSNSAANKDIDYFWGECRTRLAYMYVKSDLALDSPLT